MIAGAFGQTYTLQVADMGRKFVVETTAYRAGYSSMAVRSVATVAVKPATFTKAPVPKIAGTKRVRKRLVAKVASSTPAAETLLYQWYRNGKKIVGARKFGYVLKKADKGKRIKVAVTRCRLGYANITKYSKATAKIK
jgi:hypothetical protein